MNRHEIKILVVDDDENVRRNIEKTLLSEGFSVKTVENGVAACEIIKTTPFHLVLTDLNMPDLHGQMSDRAGIDLLGWIKENHPEIFVVLLTGAATINSTKKALSLGASDYLEKDQEPEVIIQKLLDALEINYDLKIHSSEEIKLRGEDTELLQRLFLDSSEIYLSLITKGTRGTAVYRVTSRDLDGQWRVPFATKITWKDLVLQEKENFTKWVQHRLGGYRYPALIGEPAYTFKRGGLKMLFLNTDLNGLCDYRSFFRKNDTQAVLSATEKLFNETLSTWQSRKEPEVLFLTQDYANFLDVGTWNLDKHVSRYLQEFVGKSEIFLKEINQSFPNPISKFKKLLKSPYIQETHTFIATIHGDLHASNIMVDKNKNCWLIDFSRTGKGHILRDYVELEASIKFNVLETDSLVQLCELESAVMSQQSLSDSLQLPYMNDEIHKALHVIRLIRQRAAIAISPYSDISEYYIGLLFHSLTMLRFLKESVTTTKKKSILFSAHLIFENLKKSGFKF